MSIGIEKIFEIKGNVNVKRATEIALVGNKYGNHTILYYFELNNELELNIIFPHEYLLVENKEKLKRSIRGFEISIGLQRLTVDELLDTRKGESYESVLKRVNKAKEIRDSIGDKLCENSYSILKKAAQVFDFYEKDIIDIINVSKSIAALDSCISLKPQHIAEAIQYKN